MNVLAYIDSFFDNLGIPKEIKFDIGTVLDNLRIPKEIRVEPYKYSILKLIPYKKGYSAAQFEKIMNTFHKYNKIGLDKFEWKNNTLYYRPSQPFCFEIMFTKDKLTFYFAIPDYYKTVFINKARFILSNCEIQEEEEDYIHKFQGGIKQQFNYMKSWLFSVNTSTDINITDDFLVINQDMENKNDMALVQYMFQPIADTNWKEKWQRYYDKYKRTGKVTGITFWQAVDDLTDFTLKQLDFFISGLLSGLFGEESMQIEDSKQNFSNELSGATKHKTLHDGFKSQMNLYIKSNNGLTSESISRNVQTILKDLDEEGGNSLVLAKSKDIKKPKQLDRVITDGYVVNTKEGRQFVRVLSEDRMKEFENLLDKINVEEVDMPEDIFAGKGIFYGEMKKGSIYRQMFSGVHKDSISKPFVYIGAQESGKSTFSRHYAISALEQGHSVFIIDTIDGKTMRTVRDYIVKSYPDKKIIVIDYGSEDYIFPMLWNEVSDIYLKRINETDDIIEQYRLMEEFSSAISSELIDFINTLHLDNQQQKLTDGMKKILSDIAQLVFMNDGTFSTIKDCLYDSELRHRLLNNLNLPNKLPFVQNILKIDNESESSTTLRGIDTRLTVLMENTEIQKYFSVKSDKKLDFAKWANEGYCVILNVPEKKFKSGINQMVTFLVQKLWLAILSSRHDIPEEDRTPTHLLIDEPNRFPQVMNLLRDNIIASRKWRLRFVFMIHNIEVFGRMFNNLKNSGATFLIIPPTDSNNMYKLKEFFDPYGNNELNEVQKLTAKYNGKFRFALASIHYKATNYPCILKLPTPIEMRYKPIDRSYLNKQCAKEYGMSQHEYYQNLFDEVTGGQIDKPMIDTEESLI